MFDWHIIFNVRFICVSTNILCYQYQRKYPKHKLELGSEQGLFWYYVIVFLISLADFWGWRPPQLVVAKCRTIIKLTEPLIDCRGPARLLVVKGDYVIWIHMWLCNMTMYPECHHLNVWIINEISTVGNIIFREIIESVLLNICVHLWKIYLNMYRRNIG